MVSEKSIIYGAIASFLLNSILHAYIVVKALTSVPQNLLVGGACIPFFPIWIVVILGLLKVRRWGFQLGLVISVLGIALSLAGIWLGWLEAIGTLAIDIIQVALCAYGLRKLKL